MEILGWAGGILLGICAIPQAYQCYKQKHAHGISKIFLTMWLVGELLTLAYVWPKKDLPLLFNYSVNLCCLVVIGRYMVKPDKGS